MAKSKKKADKKSSETPKLKPAKCPACGLKTLSGGKCSNCHYVGSKKPK